MEDPKDLASLFVLALAGFLLFALLVPWLSDRMDTREAERRRPHDGSGQEKSPERSLSRGFVEDRGAPVGSRPSGHVGAADRAVASGISMPLE